MIPRTALRPSLAALALLATLAGCGDDGSSGSPTGRAELDEVVAVTSGPARLLAEAAVGVERVRAAAPADASPTTWRPSNEELAAMVASRRVLVIGGEFDPWLQRAGLPPSRTVDLSDRVSSDRTIEVGTVTHTHGGGEAHSHGGVVPTFWTDPDLLREMMVFTEAEISSDVEGGTDGVNARRRALAERIEAYEEALAGLGEAFAGRTLIATDHGLEYVARAAGIELEVTLLELDEPDASPSDQGVRELQRLAKEVDRHAGLLVWPGRLDADFAALATDELGLASVHFDLGATLGGPDAPDTLERVLASVAALRSQAPSNR